MHHQVLSPAPITQQVTTMQYHSLHHPPVQVDALDYFCFSKPRDVVGPHTTTHVTITFKCVRTCVCMCVCVCVCACVCVFMCMCV